MSDREATVVRHGPAYHAVLWIGCPALGAALGWLVARLPGWLLALPDWLFALPLLPGRARVAMVSEAIGPTATIVLICIGAVGGAVLALSRYDTLGLVEVSDDVVGLQRSQERVEVPRARFGGAFLDGEELVILDTSSAEVARMATDLGPDRLAAAFERHGYAWSAGDPHADDYQRWLDGTPDLDAHLHALLRARREALEKEDAADAAGLRADLAARGIVVRDLVGKQHWRRVADGGSHP